MGSSVPGYLKKKLSYDNGMFLNCSFMVFFSQILCRENELDEEIYNQLVEKAKEEGYDVSKLRKTTHTDPPPGGDDGPKDTKGIWWIKSIFGK